MSAKVRVASADDIEPGTACQVEFGEEKLALVRVGDDFHAIADRCSHANYSLSEGEVDGDECTIECWKHGAQFSLLDGSALTLPATKGVPVYRVEVVEGEVFVSLPGAKP